MCSACYRRFQVTFQKHDPKFVTNVRFYILIVRTLRRVLRSKFDGTDAQFGSLEVKFRSSEAMFIRLV